MNENELATELNNWFNTINTNKPHFWERNPVGKVLREQMKNCEHWTDKLSGSRSGRRLAYRKMQWEIARRNGYEGDFEG